MEFMLSYNYHLPAINNESDKDNNNLFLSHFPSFNGKIVRYATEIILLAFQYL
jgi:hypothetical protein